MCIDVKIRPGVIRFNGPNVMKEKAIPSEDKPAFLPKVLTGVCKNHEVPFLGWCITETEKELNTTLATPDKIYLRGTSLVLDISFTPPMEPPSRVIPFNASASSTSDGSWLRTICQGFGKLEDFTKLESGQTSPG